MDDLVRAAVWNERPPDEPKWNTWIHRNLSENHCSECLKLDRCWFAKDATPRWPHHPFCHCVLEEIPYNEVLTKSTAKSEYSKFDPYLFDTKGVYGHAKDRLFKSWGYSVEDAEYLKTEIEKQGLEKYISGEYTLGKLNEHGQRISISIELKRKDKSSIVTFLSGWMVYPNGGIQLTTPYGG